MVTKNQENSTELESKQQQSQPSTSPSPSHESTFSISLDPTAEKTADADDKSLHQPSSTTDNLSPADEEILFHGKLLPALHHPTSPSLDTFTLPLFKNHHHQASSFQEDQKHNNKCITKEKSKSFSFLGSRRKGPPQDKDNNHDQIQKRKSKFDIIRQYLRQFKPFGSLRKKIDDDHPRLCSLSGQVKSKLEFTGKANGGELLSAPSSMRWSPTNSGRLLFASGPNTSSSMEELQASIQAAIAHCNKKEVHRF